MNIFVDKKWQEIFFCNKHSDKIGVYLRNVFKRLETLGVCLLNP
jgi:hypothetical protein